MARLLVALGCALIVLLLPSSALAAATRAGVATVDATWRVGASAGQFTDDTGPTGADGIDPHTHSLKKRISDGVALRSDTRALVLEDDEGDRVAVIAHDLYLAQDLLTRRVTTLLEQRGLDIDEVAITASHNHNTPYYSTPGWGTAIFQDAMDLRFYDYMAQRMADAVERASRKMVPVRMGAATRSFNAVQGHTYGPKVADDGTPAGQPFSYTTQQLSVVRIDDMSDRDNPEPLANWVVFGMHPEFTWGYDLINGDFTQAAARMVDRRLGTISVFSQRETGTSGPHKDTRVQQPEARAEFEDNGFNQLDRGSRLIADAILAAREDIASGTPQRRSAYQPFVEDFDVAAVSQRFAPPATRPYPGVSNCNTAALFHGDPRAPILGLPDCTSAKNPATDALTPATAALYDQLKGAGVPIPDSISPTKLTAVEETAAVHLMAMRLGDVGITFCPCEQYTATALNIETRLDRVEGNQHNGWDWTEQKTPSGRDWCVPSGEGEWTCANPQNPASDLAPVSDLAYRRMRAQINNDARGWETDVKSLGGESEPADPADIKGNFTQEEYTEQGYRIVLSVGMANDYWGYVPEYREYRAADAYRKALSGLGPHGADFLATRLARLGASLNGGETVTPSALDTAFTAEQARAQAVADGLGVAGGAYATAYDRQVAPDGGPPRIISQPADRVTRFGAAHVKFVGGSNYTDLPDVRVERKAGSEWQPYGDMTGDVQLMVDFPKAEELPLWRLGQFEWKWTASFEAFSSDIEQPDQGGEPRRQTPAGEYRFVMSGRHKKAAGAEPEPYRFASEPFTVAPWGGITAEDLRVDAGGRVSFLPGPKSTYTFGTERTYTVGPIDYPDSYDSPFRFLDGKRVLFTYGMSDPARHQQYCTRCAFRPWADTGELAEARVTFSKNGKTRTLTASRGSDGRWRTAEPIPSQATAWIAAGAMRDTFGNTNDRDSSRVTRPR